MSSQIFFLLFTTGCSFLLLCDCLTLDEYCFWQLPPTKRVVSTTRFSFIRLVLICSNIEQYSECLVSTRTWEIKGIDVFAFERTFPSEDDIYKAGYLFCSEQLYTKVYDYVFPEKLIAQCETRINHHFCINQGKMIIPKDYKAKDNRLFCNATIIYYKCLRDQYKYCLPKTDALFKYFITRVGPDCLIANQEDNDMLLTEGCRRDRSTNGQNPVMKPYGWSLIAGMICIINILQELA